MTWIKKVTWFRPSVEKTDKRSPKEKQFDPPEKKTSGVKGVLKKLTFKLNIFKIHF